jgi:hypothetical protein
MKEEDKILRKVGTDNHFTVPEGYFENLTSEVMSKLPEKQKSAFTMKEPTRWDKVKPWLYMAAMFIGAALIIRVASSDNKSVEDKTIAAETETTEPVSDQYIDVVLDHSMMDDYSLYVYLTDAE